MDNVTRQSTEASAEASLSPDQWQALGRMADNYRKLEEAGKFVTTNFGGDLTARTLELAELAQDPQLGHSLNELLQTLNLLAESGMLERLRRFVAFASETEGNLDADQLMSEALHGADAIPFGKFVSSDGADYIIHLDWTVAGTSIAIALISIAVATVFYRKHSPIPDRLARTFSGLHRAASHRFYIDEVYLFITKRIIFNGVSRSIAWFDRHVIDGAMNGLALVTNRMSLAIRGLQSGQVQQYAFVFLVGLLLITVLVLFC